MDFHYQISKTDYLAANKLHNKVAFRPQRVIFGACAGAFPIILFKAVNQTWAYTLLISAVVAAVTIELLNRRMQTTEYANYPLIQQPITFTLKEAGCYFSATDYQTFLRWENIVKYAENERYWLIYLSPNFMHIIPKQGCPPALNIELSEALANHLQKA